MSRIYELILMIISAKLPLNLTILAFMCRLINDAHAES